MKASCIIKYKDTNLKAIHNNVFAVHIRSAVVLSNTKIQIWKQFTTKGTPYPSPEGLYYQIQRYKFESNSQQMEAWATSHRVVLSNTKIQIWKQFTTHWRWHSQTRALYYQIQRYKFESNSQHPIILNPKSTVVLSNTKIQIWKQFTTGLSADLQWLVLYYQIQRYKFESNSQLASLAAHLDMVVLSNTKIQIWKQFTTVGLSLLWCAPLYYQIQRYKFESNSQQDFLVRLQHNRCIIKYKDTNLKAIHNRPHAVLGDCLLYYQIQRYKFESNSQLGVDVELYLVVVLSNTKIQIWKQFTTGTASSTSSVTLYYQIQRYKFESNSQQVGAVNIYLASCIIKYKDTNLKAIHNLFVLLHW